MISEEETALLRRFLDAVEESPKSPEAISKAIGGVPSGPTIRRYQRGELPAERLGRATRRGMERFLTGHTGEDDQLADWRDAPHGSAAVALLNSIEIPEGLSRMTGHAHIADRIPWVYEAAINAGLPPEEMRIIDAWRDAQLRKLREEKGD